ncbi:L-carnitine dehydratase/bile acid-inducible protein F [hydrothermal vent metagenome]|uniref:L-carnitine dehydratase/bile acid-inducible protein F n=1 Tax=hydrothermal vent metagenome TaxID=652676 RepID=A0A3B0TV04_9ZZZZ
MKHVEGKKEFAAGALAGVRVLDLSRILAGPTCTQLLGDLGADIIKIERPGIGDDTRKWGPPYVTGKDGEDSDESAYYLCANRNKRSITIDIKTQEGSALVRQLAQTSDILIENFRVGGLAKCALSYADLKDELPGLVYCSISGFGQTGPKAKHGGYDFLAQGAGGIMSLTGEPDGAAMKTGVAIADVMCGMYASSAILAALRHRDLTGEGQYIDLALADSQIAWLINEGTNYLTCGIVPKRRGNAHPNIVPYQLIAASDGDFILAVGNDSQFERFCHFAGITELVQDARFATNSQRVVNREQLIDLIEKIIRRHPVKYWLDGLEALNVPCGPVNDLEQVFEDEHFLHRGMRIKMEHETALSGEVELIGNPLKMTRTPVQYRRAPPTLGQHTNEVLNELLGLDENHCEKLRKRGII